METASNTHEHFGRHTDATIDEFAREITARISELQSAEHVSSSSTISALQPDFSDTRLNEQGVALTAYADFLRDAVLPHAVNVGHPRCIGHMTSPLPAFHAQLSRLVTALNQNVVKVETSKVATLIERQVLAILHRVVYERESAFYEPLVSRPSSVLGIVTSGGSLSNVTALWLARNRALGMEEGHGMLEGLRRRGYDDAVIVGSRLTHYSLRKAASLLGLGTNNVLTVDLDDRGTMDVSALDEVLEACERQRRLVIAVVGVAGTTETGSVDDLTAIGSRAQARGIHFHVDAAWGGPLAFSARHRGLLGGIHSADTVSICGHKQLYLPQGISALLCADPNALGTIRVGARYQAREGSFDLGAHSAEGSRAAMALYLHAALRLLGRRGYERLIDAGIDCARSFAAMIDGDPCFELLESPRTNIVVYRFVPAAVRALSPEQRLVHHDAVNAINQTIQQRQFAAGKSLISRTTLTHGRYGRHPTVVLRAALANPHTDRTALREVLEEQRSLGEALSSSASLEGSPVLHRSAS